MSIGTGTNGGAAGGDAGGEAAEAGGLAARVGFQPTSRRAAVSSAESVTRPPSVAVGSRAAGTPFTATPSAQWDVPASGTGPP